MAEKKFVGIRGYRSMSTLRQALGQIRVDNESNVV